jgi:hypothetical protein
MFGYLRCRTYHQYALVGILAHNASQPIALSHEAMIN